MPLLLHIFSLFIYLFIHLFVRYLVTSSLISLLIYLTHFFSHHLQALALEPSMREDMEIIGKFDIKLDGGYHVDTSPVWINHSVSRYLEILKIPYLDVAMLHNPPENLVSVFGMCMYACINE